MNATDLESQDIGDTVDATDAVNAVTNHKQKTKKRGQKKKKHAHTDDPGDVSDSVDPLAPSGLELPTVAPDEGAGAVNYGVSGGGPGYGVDTGGGIFTDEMLNMMNQQQFIPPATDQQYTSNMFMPSQQQQPQDQLYMPGFAPQTAAAPSNDAMQQLFYGYPTLGLPDTVNNSNGYIESNPYNPALLMGGATGGSPQFSDGAAGIAGSTGIAGGIASEFPFYPNNGYLNNTNDTLSGTLLGNDMNNMNAMGYGNDMALGTTGGTSGATNDMYNAVMTTSSSPELAAINGLEMGLAGMAMRLPPLDFDRGNIQRVSGQNTPSVHTNASNLNMNYLSSHTSPDQLQNLAYQQAYQQASSPFSNTFVDPEQGFSGGGVGQQGFDLNNQDAMMAAAVDAAIAAQTQNQNLDQLQQLQQIQQLQQADADAQALAEAQAQIASASGLSPEAVSDMIEAINNPAQAQTQAQSEAQAKLAQSLSLMIPSPANALKRPDSRESPGFVFPHNQLFASTPLARQRIPIPLTPLTEGETPTDKILGALGALGSAGGSGGIGFGGSRPGSKLKDLVKDAMNDTTNTTNTTQPAAAVVKKETSMRVGYYQIKGYSLTRYCYIPKDLLRSPSYSLEDAFEALQLKTPELIFEMSSADDTTTWNLKLPDHYKHAAIKEPFDPAHPDRHVTGYLRHYQDVVRGNVKRLLRATVSACSQASAVFKADPVWDMYEKNGQVGFLDDKIAQWADDSGDVPLLLLAGQSSFYEELFRKMKGEGGTMDTSKLYSPNESIDVTNDLMQYSIYIDPNDPNRPWLDENGHIRMVDDQQCYGLPHPSGSHVLISDDLQLLEHKLEQLVPMGYIVINGVYNAALDVCRAVELGRPVFVFRYTGGAADLICETLEKADEFLKLKKSNPDAVPEKPFEIGMKVGAHPAGYVWPFDRDHVRAANELNVMMDNFPTNYNPSSVLSIDMYNMSEEKLQDQLTKTMSVASNGVPEIGGQAMEMKRLTYVWRLRHMLDYNATSQGRFSDLLQVLLISFTLFTTLAAVAYTYLEANGLIDPAGGTPIEQATSAYGLVALNLLLPLAVSILRAMMAAIAPQSKFAILKMSCIKAESEIYMYRTKTGKYNPRRFKQHKVSKDDKNGNSGGGGSGAGGGSGGHEDAAFQPSKMLALAIDSIWAEISASDIKKGALISPPEYTDPLDPINKLLASNVAEQRTLTMSLRPPNSNTILKMLSRTADDHSKKAKSVVGGLFYVLSWFVPNLGISLRARANRTAKVYASSSAMNDTQKDIGNGDNLGNEKADNMGTEMVTATTTNQQQVQAQAQTQAQSALDGSQQQQQQQQGFKIPVDDGTSTLTADEYIHIRLIPQLARLMVETLGHSRLSTFVTAMVITLSVLSSILSTMQLITLIPAVLAVSGAATSWTSYRNTDLTLFATNNAINQLNQLLIWWDSLSMIEKRAGSNKEYLVQRTELAVQSQVVGVMNSQNNGDDAEKDNERDGDGQGK